jgi:uncharacterized protein
MHRVEYALFLKSAVPGQVKTRLLPALGAEGACSLYRRLREHVLALFAGERAAALQLWVLPEADDELAAWSRRFNWRVACQQGNDLGERMAHAVSCGLSRADRVVLLGSDCPGLCAEDLEAAACGEGPVLGPAADGGYWLLALDAPCPPLFDGLPWGSDEVAELTRQRLAAAKLRWRELAVRADIDRPHDLPLLEAMPWRRLPSADGPRPSPG